MHRGRLGQRETKIETKSSETPNLIKRSVYVELILRFPAFRCHGNMDLSMVNLNLKSLTHVHSASIRLMKVRHGSPGRPIHLHCL